MFLQSIKMKDLTLAAYKWKNVNPASINKAPKFYGLEALDLFLSTP